MSKDNPNESESKPELLYNGRPYELVALSAIRDDESIQVRSGLNKDTVTEYAGIVRSDIEAAEAAAAKAGDEQWLNYYQPTLPPIVVWRDEHGVLRRSDGAHRWHAHKENDFPVIPAEVRSGDKRDAKWHAMGANNHHGLKLTQNEKREIVLEILDDPKWSKKPSRDIAAYVGVSHTYVNQLKEAFQIAFDNGEYDPAAVRKLITLLNKSDRDIAGDLKAGKITPAEAEDLYEQRQKKRAAEAGEREQKKRDKADEERLAASNSASHQSEFEPKIDSPADRGNVQITEVPDDNLMSDEEWLATLPNFVLLHKNNPDAAERFRIDALNWLVLEKSGTLALLRSYSNTPPGPTGYPVTITAHKLATFPEPQHWALVANGRDYNPFLAVKVEQTEDDFEEEEEPEDPSEAEPDLMDQLQSQFNTEEEEGGWSGGDEEY